jgi:hypothetical protein
MDRGSRGVVRADQIRFEMPMLDGTIDSQRQSFANRGQASARIEGFYFSMGNTFVLPAARRDVDIER